MTLLITKAELIAAKPRVSVNIKDDKIFNQVLTDAQELDLMPFLGNAFYLDLITNADVSPIPTAYNELLNGVDYTNSCNELVRFFGLKKVIINYTYARLLENNNIVHTRAGAKYKDSNSSERVSQKDLSSWVNNARSQAVAFEENARQFLCDHKDIYPLYKEKERRTSIQFFKSQRNSTNIINGGKRYYSGQHS